MTGTLTAYDGRRFALPPFRAWRLQYGGGDPCDCFEVFCPWGEKRDGALGDAVFFEALERGKTVFRGVVDEYEHRWTAEGSGLFLSGRGMAALLLDNEAAPAEYQWATLEDILRDHVAPYGIQVAEKAAIPPAEGFVVESGSSEWQVLREFTRYHGGVEPRFDREGRLTLAPWGDGRRLLLDEKSALTAARLRERRYGVVSEVLVLDRTRKASSRVADRELLDRGYRCRRVLNMPGRSSYQQMRYRGEYQLREAGRERLRVELTLPEAFAAWPGELVELRRARPELSGTWRVREVETGADADGAYSVVRLGEM